jgi:hypothetical protein
VSSIKYMSFIADLQGLSFMTDIAGSEARDRRRAASSAKHRFWFLRRACAGTARPGPATLSIVLLVEREGLEPDRKPLIELSNLSLLNIHTIGAYQLGAELNRADVRPPEHREGGRSPHLDPDFIPLRPTVLGCGHVFRETRQSGSQNAPHP